ncbi:hypothetical protein [Lysobacter capsici]|uniref:hypothetical protein n=1 Tax=Lysobacter capsici TaxID=435897 RepID=UPI001BFFDA68|nr:hypothetical protein [Lysobacter capsici]QWF16911.1 hypothetical protein KME82_24795 [Lysobacter capsici]
MKTIAQTFVALSLSAMLPTAHAAAPMELCKLLRSFAESIQPNSEQEFTYRISWGENFKDSAETVLGAKRCEHNGYGPARNICSYLMEHGSVESAGVIVMHAVSCLTRKSRFDPSLRIHGANLSFSYGGRNRDALIDLTYEEDKKVGGMALRLVATGY